jgi:putative transposase
VSAIAYSQGCLSLHASTAAHGRRRSQIEPSNPWENGYVESFNGKFPDELLNGELFYTLHEAQALVERWRGHYNTHRAQSALGYRPPAPEARMVTPVGLSA